MRMIAPAALSAALLLSVCPMLGQKSGKRSTPVPVSHATKGTAQLAGDNGKMGVTYTIGKGRQAVNFTLLSAEYSGSRFVAKDNVYVPKEDEKLLVLHFTLQNPNPNDTTVNWATLRYTAIDSKDVNHKDIETLQKEGTTESTQVALRPGQKLAARTAIIVPFDVSVPKLMVEHSVAAPVLRVYFKPGDIKPVGAPFGDPKDQTGCLAPREVMVPAGEYAPLRFFDVKLVSSEYTGSLGDEKPRVGTRFFVARVMVRNGTATKRELTGPSFSAGVKTDDGDKTKLSWGFMFCDKRDAKLDADLEPGEEIAGRIIIEAPVDVKVAELRLQEVDGLKVYVFKVP